MIILVLKTNIGDGRQRAEEHMGTKKKTHNAETSENAQPKSIYPMSLMILLAVCVVKPMVLYGFMMSTGRFGKKLSFRAEATGRGRRGQTLP